MSNDPLLETAAWAVQVGDHWAIHAEDATFLALLTDDGFQEELDARTDTFRFNLNGNWTKTHGVVVFSLMPPFGELRSRARTFLSVRALVLFDLCAFQAQRDGMYWRLDLEPHQALPNRTEIVDISIVKDLCKLRNLSFDFSGKIDLRRMNDG